MGGNVSKTVFRKASRPLKNINIENRAQKAIQKQKDNPKPAPRHASTVDIFKQQSAGRSITSSQCNYSKCIIIIIIIV